MSDIKLFRTNPNGVTEIESRSVAVEKSLQELVERNLETFLGIRFLASEHSTGEKHGGRIDTLGIDENGCPVIIEYKRAVNQNVINQGLFYLDWLMDHRAEFRWLVLEKFGKETADDVEWSAPRLLCIAGDFTRYDEHAVQQMNRNIELIRYRHFGDGELLLLELVNATSADSTLGASASTGNGATSTAQYKTVSQHLEDAGREQTDRFEVLKEFLVGLGDDVQMKTLKYYIAFKRLKNFACVEIRADGRIVCFVKVPPDSVELEENFTRDVRDIGHYGTGDLEVTIASDKDFERAQPLLIRSYEES